MRRIGITVAWAVVDCNDFWWERELFSGVLHKRRKVPLGIYNLQVSTKIASASGSFQDCSNINFKIGRNALGRTTNLPQQTSRTALCL